MILGAMLLIALLLIVTARAEASNRVDPKHQTSGATEQYPLPKHWRTYVRVAQCEQPAAASVPSSVARKYWMGVRWDHPGRGNGGGWPGGLGMMHIHWEQFKPKGAPRLQEDATPAQQLISAHRAYVYFRKIYGVRGGTTFWVCSEKIGWGGIDPKTNKSIWY